MASVAASMNRMLTALGMAREAQRQLVEDASHELATPLTSLRTNIDLLLRAERSPDRKLEGDDKLKLLSDVEAQMGELDHLIEEVVELARDPGSTDEATELDLASVVRTAVGRARTRSPEVSFTLTDQPIMVFGKRSGLERAVLNLLDNAAKWSPPDYPVRVDVRYEGGLADIVVADRGPGVPAAEQERVFERFYRTAEARSMPGSGLGLAIVRQVVTAHGGPGVAGAAACWRDRGAHPVARTAGAQRAAAGVAGRVAQRVGRLRAADAASSRSRRWSGRRGRGEQADGRLDCGTPGD